MTEKKQEQVGELAGIYLAEFKMSNMDMERIVVSNPAIIEVLKVTKLSEAAQEEAVEDLVGRTTNWLELETEEQIAKIKAVLTQESVIEYLRAKDIIRDKVDVLQTGIDEEGSIVIEAYYTNLNREQRRAVEQTMSDAQKKRMAEAVNVLGQENIIDLARKKMEKMEEQKKRRVK